MNRREYPYTTTTAGLSVFDRDNQYRPLQWIDAANEIDWLDREDNGLLLTILERLPSMSNEFDNPIVNWTEDTRMEVATKLNGALTAGGTTVTVDDPYIAVVGTQLVFPTDGEIIEVTAVDYTNSQWTVTRGLNGTAAAAKVDDDDVIAMPAYMAELDDPRDGVGRTPGTSQHNFISLVSKSFKVGVVQNNSLVYDNWGQVPKAAIDTVLDLRRELGYALLFQARATRTTANSGQLYISQGALHYNKDGFLDLGTQANQMTWQVLNDFFEDLFDNDASSMEKTMLAGQDLFSTGIKMMRDLNRLDTAPYFEPTLKTQAYDIRTDGGFVVHVLLDKYGLNSKYGLGSWGFVFDMAHVMGAHYKGLDFQWFQNIQDNRSVLLREDTYMGSFSLVMKHQATHGVIRGGSGRIVER